MNMEAFEKHHKNAHRQGKVKRSGQDVDYVTCRNRNEMSVKDAVLQVFEQKTQFMPDIQARLFARQLSEAFKIAGEALE